MTLKELIQNRLVRLDGGTGTLLQRAGLRPGESSELWSLSHPEVLREIHRAYYDAGSHIVTANTFGVNAFRYSGEELEKLISAAVENVRLAARESAAPQPKFAALDIGPLGKLLKPLGDVAFEDAVAAFAACVRAGVKAGADLVLIETMNDSYETKAALLAAKENCDLPVLVSNAYGEDGRLMTGGTPETLIPMLEGMGADAIGVNCSFGARQLMPVLEKYLENASVPVLFMPNAGLPKVVDGETTYDVTPEEFGADIAESVRKGVRLVGGCCGTTPAHIRAMTEAVRDIPPLPVRDQGITSVSSGIRAVRFGRKPVLIGERLNPTGKKRLKQALLENDLTYLLNEALTQQDRRADVLDVNAGLPGIDETAVLASLVPELQAVVDTPLQLDTASPSAMEAALRVYHGKAMINSVNGKQESMDAVFPLAKKYGGLVVALTLDENGIPATAQGRIDIAKKILREAERYGIGKKDLIFDPLTLTVSAEPMAARVTLEALCGIRAMGCLTSLGVSNVSFGLPDRDTVNSAFFALAMENGLSAAIMNPCSAQMMAAYRCHLLLQGMDPGCEGYIAFASDTHLTVNETTAGAGTKETGASTTGDAIRKGLRQQATEMAKQLLTDGAEPMALIRDEVIPALDAVGKDYENKKVYLPQLLMSAEAAAAVFEQVKTAMRADLSGADTGCPFVLATVRGDIHDIGKNIVRLLLENYGFRVIDLGRDVDKETILQAVLTNGARLLGLSALMTTTVPAMQETIALVHAKAPECRIIVGGAVLTAEYAHDIGADHYAKDAMDTVRIAQEIRDSAEEYTPGK